MTKVIGNFGTTKGTIVGLGMYGDGVGSVHQEVHDGDTVNVRVFGNLAIRLLALDTPEISYIFPAKSGSFKHINHQDWQDFLADPFAQIDQKLFDQGLLGYLAPKFSSKSALNHHRHSKQAEDVFECLISGDMEEQQLDKKDFRFFLAFSFEIMDRYGRFLCYVNRNQKSKPRPDSYNERLLALGAGSPYFIWPNINPWRTQKGKTQAVLEPNSANTIAESDTKLRKARQAVKRARSDKIGIYEMQDPLTLEPFELRFLARGTPPIRHLIDLSTNDDRILKPSDYHTISNPEDRLWIPTEYIPLFEKKGWRVG